MSKLFLSPTKLIATLAAIVVLLPASAQWNNIAPNNGGQSIKFVSSSVGYLQNVYTMQKTTDGGVTWVTIDSVGGALSQNGMFWLNANEGFSVYSENLGFGNYAGWFKKTTNGGSTWTPIQQVSATSALNAVWFTSSSTGFVVGENGLIRKTINGGTNWTTLTSTTTLDLYSIEFVNATTGWVGGDDGIILKTVNASSWTQQFASIFYEFQDIAFTDPMNGCATGTYGLLRTTNGGATWNPITVYGTYQFLSIDFPSADTGYMTSVGGNVFRTIDGGASWIGLNRIPPGYMVRDCDFISNDTGFVTIDFAGTWKTSNAGSGCPTMIVQNTVSMPDTIRACANSTAVFTASASAVNPYIFNVTPSWVWDTAASYGQYFYVSDSIANDTLPIIITMMDTTTNCGMLTDFVILITDSTTYQPLSQPTWLLYLCPGDSIVLDLGPGAENGYTWQMLMDTTQTITVDTVGMWNGMAHACGNNYGYIFFVQWDTACAQVCSVDAGPDTVFCQLQGQLNATPASPGTYTFSWSPAYGLDNPNAQNPNVVTGVHNQQYIVTMTDTANNCTAMDTVIVSAYYWHIDTLYMCQGQPITYDLGPGGIQYTVQFTDTSGNFQYTPFPPSTYVITQPASYIFIAQYPGCGALTSLITVIDSCVTANVPNVWPGDCNYDLVVNMADALNVGLGYGTTGATRPNASNAWYAQPMNDWSQNFATCNYKHGDANGDGIINVGDTLPISQNYTLTHPFRLGAPQIPASAPALTLVCTPDTVGLQTLVQVDVVLGSVTVPIDSLYGISFRITSEAGLIDTSLTAINANNSWLGTGSNMFTFQKHFASSAIVDFAEVKNNHINTLNGSGVIASFFIVTTDNLSGIQTCNFDLSDITAVTESQTYIQLAPVNDSVVIDPSVMPGFNEYQPTLTFSMYPNPANDKLTVKTTSATEVIEICDMSGRVVKTVSPMGNTSVIETSSLANGMYLVNVKNGASVTTQKLTISR
jgi:photosystem II stability/assembly factor-like uncharacterized protein